MILIIPEIDLKQGQCVQLIQGEAGTETLYKNLSQNPFEMSKLLRRENAKSIHVKDLDSLENQPSQLNLDAILFIAHSVDIPVQVHSHFKDTDECFYLIKSGVYRTVLDDLVYIDPNGVQKLVERFTPSRVVFYMRSVNGMVYSEHLKSDIPEVEYCRHIKSLGGQRVIYKTDKFIDENDNFDLAHIQKICREEKLRFTIEDGINKAEQLLKLQSLLKSGIDSLIIGEALYLNSFPCQRIWRLIEAELEPEIQKRNIQ